MQAIRVERELVEALMQAVQEDVGVARGYCRPIVEDEVRKWLENVVSNEAFCAIRDEDSWLRDCIVNAVRGRIG